MSAAVTVQNLDCAPQKVMHATLLALLGTMGARRRAQQEALWAACVFLSECRFRADYTCGGMVSIESELYRSYVALCISHRRLLFELYRQVTGHELPWKAASRRVGMIWRTHGKGAVSIRRRCADQELGSPGGTNFITRFKQMSSH